MNKHLCQLAAVLVTLIACGALLDWQFNIPLLKIGFPVGSEAMKPNTAFCLLLSSISLGVLQRQRLSLWLGYIGQACALLTATIGLLTLSEYFFGWNIGIDQFLFHDGIPTIPFLYPGRMGEVTAFDFVLLGIALLSLGQKNWRWNWLAQSLSCVVITTTFVLVSSLFERPVFYDFLVFTTASIPFTDMTLILLCVGILFTHPDKGFMQIVTSSSVGGVLSRRLFPWAIIVPLAMNWLSIWGFKVNKYDHTFIHTSQTIIIILVLLILILSNAKSTNQVEAYHQRAEQKLRESEQRLRRAVMYSPLPIMIHAEDGEVVQINHAWTEITGYKLEDILTIAKWTERAYQEDQESVREIIDCLYNLDGHVAEGEFTISTNHGSQCIWDFYSAPLGKDPDGRRLVLTTAIDITKRKQAEQALVQMNATLEMRVSQRTAELAITNQRLQQELYERQRLTQALQKSEHKFRAIFEQTFQFIGLLAPDGTVLEVNQAPLNFIRAQREDVINQLFWELSCWGGNTEIQENLKAAIAKAATGEFIRREITLPDADGVITNFDFSLKPVRNESGEVVLLIPEGRDITKLKQIQSELRSVSDRLKHLLAASPAVIFSCRSSGDYGATFISENVTTILGYQPQDFTENSDFWVSHIHPEDLKPILKSTSQIFQTDQHSHQYRFLCADGTYCWLETHTKLVRKKGNPVEFVGYLIDINQRKATEAALQESEERFQAFMNHSPAAAWIADTNGKVLYASPTYLRTFQVPTENLIGKTFFDLYPAKFVKEWVENIKMVAVSNQVLEVIETAPRRDGTVGDFLVYKFPIKGLSEEQIVGGVAVDITERRRAELALAEREALLRSIGDNLPDGAIYQLARDRYGNYCLHHISAGIEKLTEIKPEDALKDLSLLHKQCLEEDYSNLRQITYETIQNLSVFNIELRTRTPSGKLKWLHLRASPRSFDNGEIVWDGLVVDITDIKQAEQALQLQTEREKALNRVIQAIRNSLDLQTIFNTAVTETAQILQADQAVIVKYIPSQKLWKHMAEYVRTPDILSVLENDIPDDGNEIATRLKKLEIVRIDNPKTINDQVNADYAQTHMGGWLMVPLHINSTLWGSLTIMQSEQNSTLQDPEVELTIAIADQLMITIQQSELYQQLEIANHQLERLATLDGLTQIANRRRFDQYLQKEWLRLAREKNPLSLILCDVDYFKLYNDTYGHPAGDNCLIKIAQTIGSAVKRPADLVARYGGEEFVVILPNTDNEGAIKVVQAIQKEMRELDLPHIGSLTAKCVTLSFGIATILPSHESSPEALIQAADSQLYQAKDKGRNGYQSIDTIDQPHLFKISQQINEG